MKEEKTIEEMQPTVFDIRYYEYHNDKEQMIYYPEATQSSEGMHQKRGKKDQKATKQGNVVEGREYEGMGLRKD